MTDLTEVNNFDTGITQLEVNTPALGGPGGPMNAQAQSLANRTKNLNTRLAAVESGYQIGDQFPGGTVGQVLSKASNADGDCEWADGGTGGGGTTDVVVETQTLAASQTTITLLLTTNSNAAVYIEGVRDFDWTPSGSTQIILDRSYPAGTEVSIVQGDPLGVNLYARKDLANTFTQPQTIVDGTAPTHQASKGQMDTAIAVAVAPLAGKLIAEIFMFPGTPVAPGATEFILCDGRRLDRTLYASLFSALGGVSSPWGLPDGSGFNIPDLQGRVAVGSGSGTSLTARAMAAKSGEENHTLTIPEMPAHTHTAGAGGATFVTRVGSAVYQGAANAGGEVSATDSTGGGGSHNNMQPFTVIGYYIRSK